MASEGPDKSGRKSQDSRSEKLSNRSRNSKKRGQRGLEEFSEGAEAR